LINKYNQHTDYVCQFVAMGKKWDFNNVMIKIYFKMMDVLRIAKNKNIMYVNKIHLAQFLNIINLNVF
jgi:hypothetical protein